MSSSSQSRSQVALELQAVVDAGEAGLRARTEQDEAAIAAAAQRLRGAVGAALAAGHSLSSVAAAGRRGEEQVRGELAGRVLGQIRRAAQRRREAELAHEQAIALGARLGLPHRDIAAAAELAAGTVRAVLARVGDRGESARPTEHDGGNEDGTQLEHTAPNGDSGEEAPNEC